jgi:outer membrane biosynthesis protein TonB
MLWIVLFIIGLLVLLAGLVPLLLNGRRRLNIVAVGLGAVIMLAGIAGVIIRPSLTMPVIAALEEPATDTVPEPAPSAAPPAPTEEPAPDPNVRVVDPAPPAEAPQPAPSQKDESQLEPSPLPDPVPVATTPVPGETGEALPGTTPPAPTPSPAAAPAEDGIAALALTAQQPKDQTAFATVIGEAKKDFDAVDVEGQMDIQPQRAAAICKALPKPEVKNWVGSIQAADADSGGRLTVTIALPDGTLVKTWNNAMSDLDDNTLVQAGTPLAAAFGKLKTGDAVRFAGTFFSDEADCYRSTRLALGQSVKEPSFLFRFTSVEKL